MASLWEALKPAHVGLLVSVYVVCRVAYSLILWPRYFSTLRAVPTAKLQRGIRFQEWAKELGPVIRILGMERLIFVQPEQLHQVLAKDWLDYPKPTYLQHIFGIVSGYGLLTTAGNEHRLMRKAMNPAFSLLNLVPQIQMYYNSIDGLVEILSNQVSADLQEGKVICLYDWISKATLDIVCEAGLGYRVDSLHNPDNELVRAYRKLAALQTGPNLLRMSLALELIPGFPKLVMSPWMYRHRLHLGYTVLTDPLRLLLEAMHETKKASAKLLQGGYDVD